MLILSQKDLKNYSYFMIIIHAKLKMAPNVMN